MPSKKGTGKGRRSPWSQQRRELGHQTLGENVLYTEKTRRKSSRKGKRRVSRKAEHGDCDKQRTKPDCISFTNCGWNDEYGCGELREFDGMTLPIYPSLEDPDYFAREQSIGARIRAPRMNRTSQLRKHLPTRQPRRRRSTKGMRDLPFAEAQRKLLQRRSGRRVTYLSLIHI